MTRVIRCYDARHRVKSLAVAAPRSSTEARFALGIRVCLAPWEMPKSAVSAANRLPNCPITGLPSFDYPRFVRAEDCLITLTLLYSPFSLSYNLYYNCDNFKQVFFAQGRLL
jgi:hypothetical protein